jgi:hypothetical protein
LSTSTASSRVALILGDIDNDGDPDAVMPNRKKGTDDAYDVFINDGNGNFEPLTTGGGRFDPGESRGVALGDVNQDGFLDAVVTLSSGSNRLYLNNGLNPDGSSKGFTSFSSFGGGSGSGNDIALANLNGDGWLDAIVARSGSNSSARLEEVYFNNQNVASFFPSKASYTFGGFNSTSLAVADMNGDGHLDVLVAHSNGPNGVYLNNGSGVLSLAFEFDSGESTGVTAIDLTLDGRPDVVVTNRTSAGTTWLNCTQPGGAMCLTQLP